MSNLGKTLERARKNETRQRRVRYHQSLHSLNNKDDNQCSVDLVECSNSGVSNKLVSTWETSNLDDILNLVHDREQKFAAERNVRIVSGDVLRIVSNDKRLPGFDDRDWVSMSSNLPIPKRPVWDYRMSSESLKDLEEHMFTDWRRFLSQYEEKTGVVMTPYEKNLEVWRQLWRVVERSDIVLEIVDARNPLIFRCSDFERYVQSMSSLLSNEKKKLILLLNKADFLTEEQRRKWANNFQHEGITFFFFSAVCQNTKSSTQVNMDDSSSIAEDDLISKTKCRKHKGNRKRPEKLTPIPIQVGSLSSGRITEHTAGMGRSNSDYSKDEIMASKPSNKLNPPDSNQTSIQPSSLERMRTTRIRQYLNQPQESSSNIRLWKVLSPDELLDELVLLRFSAGLDFNDFSKPITVGLLGYPNVGKSSTINSILGTKKVTISTTPGKTKFFQTLLIPEERRVMLCDCPGLVFPSFSTTRANMICDGILPIDTVRDYTSAIEVLCTRIPRLVFEVTLSISLDKSTNIDEDNSNGGHLLSAYARRRGYLTEHDKPDRARAAKELLKFHVDGRLLYAQPPPNCTVTSVDSSRPKDLEINTKTISENEHANSSSLSSFSSVDDSDDDSSFGSSSSWETVSNESCFNEKVGFLETNQGEPHSILDSTSKNSQMQSFAISEENCHVDTSRNRHFTSKTDETKSYRSKDFFTDSWHFWRPSGGGFSDQSKKKMKIAELFNKAYNYSLVKKSLRESELASLKEIQRRQRKKNPQLESDIQETLVNTMGEVELIIDDSDEIIECILPEPKTLNGHLNQLPSEKMKQQALASLEFDKLSKRQKRRAIKSRKEHVPAKSFGRVMAVNFSAY